MSVEMRSTREWALLYGEHGWPLFVVEPMGKRPMFKGWLKDATTDPEKITRYWRRDPAPNVGAVCGRTFDVFDVEAAFVSTLTDWQAEHGYILPETPMARSGRGGIHIFTKPVGVDGSRNLYLEGVHIGELKSKGGGVILTPSITDSRYSWLWLPDNLEVAPAPPWLLTLLDRPKGASIRRWPSRLLSASQGERRLNALARAVAGAPVGERNAYLYWAARRAAQEGVPLKFLGLALLRAAIAAGLPEREAKATIVSAVRAEGGDA